MFTFCQQCASVTARKGPSLPNPAFHLTSFLELSFSVLVFSVDATIDKENMVQEVTDRANMASSSLDAGRRRLSEEHDTADSRGGQLMLSVT